MLKADKYFDYVSFEIKQTRSTLLVELHIAKQCAEDEDASNNSMDVRAKHGRCFVCQLARCFAPRHLNRWAFSLETETAG